MADSFTVSLSIRVDKQGQQEPVIDETNIFSDKSFGSMVIHAADFYELITKLRAKK